MHSKRRSWVRIGSLCSLLAMVTAGCARGAEACDVVVDQDTGAETLDAGMDTGTTRDTGTHDQGTAHPDTGTQVDTGHDTGITVVDVPVVPVDTGAPRVCTTGCNTDADCQTTCPIPSSGSTYCCSGGGGGSTGVCYVAGGTCPIAVDSGVPVDTGTTTGGGGMPGDFCTMSSQCSAGGSNCCLSIAGIGECGCAVPIFGCLPCS